MRQFRAPKIAAFEVFDYANRNWADYASNVDEWVQLACLMNAERIKLRFNYFRHRGFHATYPFPFHLLNAGKSSNLKHLSLHWCTLALFSSLVGPILSLTTLELSCISSLQNIGTFEDMAFYFPNLENLTYDGSVLPGMQKICDLCCRMNNLKSLVVSGYKGLADFEFHNTNLRFFKYYGAVRSISFKGLNCLEIVKVATEWSGDSLTKFFLSLLNEVPQLVRLSVGMLNFKDFRFPSSMSTFKCLKYLRLNAVLPLDSDLDNLSRLLQCATILQELRIDLFRLPLEWLEEQLPLPQVHTTNSQSHHGQRGCIVHVCPHLKKVKIQRGLIRFGWKDVELIIMLLESVTSVEEMILKGDKREDGEELQKVLAQYSPAIKFVFPSDQDRSI